MCWQYLGQIQGVAHARHTALALSFVCVCVYAENQLLLVGLSMSPRRGAIQSLFCAFVFSFQL